MLNGLICLYLLSPPIPLTSKHLCPFYFFLEILPGLEGALLSVDSQLSLALVGASAPGGTLKALKCWEPPLFSAGQVAFNVLGTMMVYT